MSARIDFSDAYAQDPPVDFSDVVEPVRPPKRLKNSYDDLIEKHAAANNLDPDLLRAVMVQESGGNPRAVSPKGARGLMQLMPGTARRFGVRDTHDPDQNISGGAKYLRFLLDRFKGDVPKTLAGYNAGEGAVDKFGGIPPYHETRNYVRTITGRYKGKGYAGQPQVDFSDAELPTFSAPDMQGENRRVDFSDVEMQREAEQTPVVVPGQVDPTVQQPVSPLEEERTDEFAPASPAYFAEQAKPSQIDTVGLQAVELNRRRRIARVAQRKEIRRQRREARERAQAEAERQRLAEEIRRANQQAVSTVSLPRSEPETPEVFKQPRGQGFDFAPGYRPKPSYTESPRIDPTVQAAPRENAPVTSIGQLREQENAQSDLYNQIRQNVIAEHGGAEFLEQAKRNYQQQGRNPLDIDRQIEAQTQARAADYQTRLERVRRAESSNEPLGFMDKIRELGDNPLQLLPFISSAKDISDILTLGQAARRLREDKATQEDLLLLREFNAQQKQDSTFGYKVANVLSALPAFAGEIGLTGGVYNLVKKGAIKGIEKAVRRLATEKGAEFLESALAKRGVGALANFGKNVAGSLAASAVQTPLAATPRIAAQTGQLMLPDVEVSEDDRGKLHGIITNEGDDFKTALRKAATDQYIEVASEHAGGTLDYIPVPARFRAIKAALLNRWFKLNPNSTVAKFNQTLKQIGWHGVLGEMFEERVGDVMKSATGRQSWSEAIPSLEQLAVEGLSFSVPSVAFNVAEKGLERLGRKNVRETDTQNVQFNLGEQKGSENLGAEVGSENVPQIVPESETTLSAQKGSAESPESPRLAVFYPKSSGVPETQPGFVRVPLPDGFLLLNRKKARGLGLGSIKSIQDYVTENGIEPLIGKVAPVEDTSTGAALRTEDAAGNELSTSIVPTPEAAAAQAEVDRQQFPQAANQEVMPAQAAAARRMEEGGRIDFSDAKTGSERANTPATDTVPGALPTPDAMAAGSREDVTPADQTPTAGREETPVQPRRWSHADFGVVTETPNQSGVGKGRVRVIDAQGKEHVIQSSNGRGQGNVLAVPVRRGIRIEPREGAPEVRQGTPTAPPEAQEGGKQAIPRSETEKREIWYHGSPVRQLQSIKPGNESRDKYDIPRQDAVYITKNIDYAKQRGAQVYQVEIKDRSKLLPDEDVIFDLLNDKREPTGEKLRQEWQRYSEESWSDSSERLAEADDFSAVSQEMIGFAEHLASTLPALTRSIIEQSGSAAHKGELPVVPAPTPATQSQGSPEVGDSYRSKRDGRVLEVRKSDEREVVMGERGGEGDAIISVSRARFHEDYERTEHKFSSTQVDLPESEAKQVQALGQKLIPDSAIYTDPKDDSYGREEHPHVTVKYGLHTEDAADVRRVLADEPPVTVRMGKTSIFPAKGDAQYDVVKIDVDSPDLHRLNAKISKALKVTDTHPEYKPHVTLAYVKKGEGSKYAGNSDFQGKEITLNSISFSSSNGETVDIPLKSKGGDADEVANPVANVEAQNQGGASPAPSHSEESTTLVPGTRALIDTIKGRIAGAGIKDNPTLTKLADEHFAGTRAEGRYDAKDAYDALETAVNEYLAGNARSLMEAEPREALKTLRGLMKRLPRQTDRTDEQKKLQQFSTPPTEAYIAARALAPTDADIVLEPSAGTGSLALWPKAVGAKVYANEISPRRKALLEMQGYETTDVDAQFLNDLLPKEIKPTAILMNPPFSSTGGRVKNNRTIYGAEHVSDALVRLQEGGRLVAIVGEGMALGKPAFNDWWRKVMRRYNVRANISVPGGEYGAYGTTFGNQLLVIDKTGRTPGETFTEQIRSVIRDAPADLEGVLDAVEPLIHDRPEITGTEPRDDLAEREGDRRGGDRSTSGSLEPGVSTGRVGVRPTGADAQDGAARPSESGSVPSEDRPDPSLESSGESVAQAEGQDSGRGDSDVQLGIEFGRRTRDERAQESDSYVQYTPSKLRGGKPHPANIVESASMAAVDPPDITYKPRLDPSIIKEGKLSDLQYESVVYAGQRHEQRLPNGSRAGYFVGDGTGVGKGRILAGIALDNWNRKRRRILWLSINYDLVPSTERDLKDLGANVPLGRTDDYAPADDLNKSFGDGVLFSSYSTLISQGKTGATRFDQITKWLGPDGVIMFDEAHLAKNAVQDEGSAQKTSQRADKVVELQTGDKTRPDWRIVYASATGATDVRNMGYMQRLGLWGPGTSFPGGFAEFQGAIEKGGVGAMEMVARDMKALGMYSSRSISYQGVDYREVTHDLYPEQKEIYDLAANAWGTVLQNFEAALDSTGANGRGKSFARSRFWSSQQIFFRQFLTALKVPAVIRETERALNEGSIVTDPKTGEQKQVPASVVIGLIGTGEARAKEEVSRALAAGLSLDELDFSPKSILLSLVERSFPTQRYTDATDEETGKTKRVPLVDRDGRKVESEEAKAMRDALMRELDKLTLPENPLDQIVNHFGPDKVAEITGRDKRLTYNPETGKKEYQKRARKGVSMEKASQDEMEQFQSGRKRIAIISQSASTGISLHADLRADSANNRRVHITLETGWSADVQMQTFGRTHRSNQSFPPEYVLLSTNVGGEKRFLSTVARRLASLGALTKGDRKSAGSGDLGKYDFENHYGEAAARATVKYLIDNEVDGRDGLKVLLQMGIAQEDPQSGAIEVKDEKLQELKVSTFLNRLLALPVQTQNVVFEQFTTRLENIISDAKRNGLFDEGVADIKGKDIRLAEEPKVVATDETTGAETVYYQIDVDEPTNPLSFGQVTELFKSGTTFEQGGRSGINGTFWRQKRSGNVIAVEEAGTRTDASTSRSIYRFHVYKPSGVADSIIEGDELREKYERVQPDTLIGREGELKVKVSDWWDAQYKQTPKIRTARTHVIGGAVIPVWQRLGQRDADNRRVQLKAVRVVTAKGQRIVGIRIPARAIGGVLRALGVSRNLKSSDAIFSAVLDGEAINLIGGMKLERATLKGSQAIKLEGWTYYQQKELEQFGLHKEILNYRPQFFVPTDETKGVPVLEKLLERYPAIGDDSDTSPLKMAHEPEPLRHVENAALLAPRIVLERDGDILKVNDAGQEFLRRAFEQNAIDRGEPEGPEESPFEAVFLNPKDLRSTVKTLRRAAREMRDKGYTKEEAAGVDNLAEQLLAAARADQGTAIVMLNSATLAALPHESFHQGGHLGAEGRALEARHARLSELARHKAVERWRAFYGSQAEYQNASDALAVEEAAATIAGGDYAKMDLTLDEATDYLNLWFDSYIEQNGDQSVETFRRQREDIQSIIEAAKARVANRAQEDRPALGSLREDQGLEPGESPPRDQETFTEGETLKRRALPRTLRAKGLQAADQLYATYPNRAALADARRLFERLGFNGSEALLKSDRQKSAADMALSDLLQRALLNAASEASTSDPALAASLRVRQQDLAATLAEQATRAGQFIQAAQASAHSVEDVMQAAQRVARERGTPLTEAEAKRIQEAGEELERRTAEAEVAAVEASERAAEVETGRETLARAEDGLLAADEIKRLEERLQELKERESERTREGADLAGKLARMRARLSSLAAKEKRREMRVAELEGQLPPRERKLRKAGVRVREKAIELLAAREDDLMADLRSILGGTSPLKMARVETGTPQQITDETIDKLAQVGALRLLRAEKGSLSVEEFKRGMLRDFGASLRPHLDRIHAEAVRIRRETLRRARREGEIERIAEREGNEDLSREELEEIADAEARARRRAQIVQSEHERAARTFSRTIGSEVLDSKALAEAIGRNAQSDIEAISAAKLARSNMNAEHFSREMQAEHNLSEKESREAFIRGGKLLERARNEINRSRQLASALKPRIAQTESERDQAVADLQQKRAEAARARRGFARQLEALQTSRAERVAKRAWRESKGVSIALMASGDMSSFLRQGGATIAMQPSLAPEFAAALFKSIGRKGHAKLINKIEKGKDFSLKQRMGIDFAFAGRGGEGGDEFFENAELLERIPGIKQWVEASDRVFGGSLDELRDALADVLISDLRARGVSYSKNPKAYKDLGRFINIITGRADIGNHNAALTKAYLNLGRAIGFAPRYRISRMQFLTLPLNRSFWHAAPEARRIIYKNYGRWFATMGALYGILAALGWLTGGIVSTYFDPDDDDFLKLKVGKARLDMTGGLQVPARFIGRLLLESYRGLTSQVTPEMAGKQMLSITGRYLYSGLDPRASLAVEWWNQETYDRQPFTWFGDYGIDGALGTRLMPINISQAMKTAKKEGEGYAAAQYGAEFFGAGTNVYPDRPDQPKTTAEKLATRFAYKNEYTSSGQPIDEDTKRKLDELKGRSRAGEDVEDEVNALVEADKINERKADSIINAKDQTYLQEKFRQLSLEDARHVLKYATPDERAQLEDIMRSKALNRAEKEAKEEEKLADPERAKIRRERARKAQNRKRERRELRYGDQVNAQ